MGLFEEWAEKSAETRAKFHPGSGRSSLNSNPWAELSPELANVVNDMAMGGVYSNPALELKTRALCTVAALVALGEETYAVNWMRNALNVGATQEELVTIIDQLFVYIGTPKTVSGFRAVTKAVSAEGGR